MRKKNFIHALCVGIMFCGSLGMPGYGRAGVVVPEQLNIGSLKFPDGTTQATGSGAAKVWSGVINTLAPPAMGGSGAYLYAASRTGTGSCTLFFNYAGQTCVVSAQSSDSSCFVFSQATNSSVIHCTKHSDNSLVDATFAFICLAP